MCRTRDRDDIFIIREAFTLNPQPLSPFTHTLIVTFVTVGNLSTIFPYYFKGAPTNPSSPLTLVTSGGANLVVCGPRLTRNQSLNFQGHGTNIIHQSPKCKFFEIFFRKFFFKFVFRKFFFRKFFIKR